MRFVTIDFETYFADDYTLSKMTTEAYIRDSRFQAHGAAIKWSKDHAAKWYDEPQLRYVLSQEDWSDVCLIHHHAQFDGLILSHHYGVLPRLYGCTLSMARLLLGNHISVSLDSVRKTYGLQPKTTPYNLFRGTRWGDLDNATRSLIAEGACDEVESIWKLFGILAKDFPTEEYLVVDQTIRMFTQPVLRADTDLLAKIWSKEENDRRTRIDNLRIVPATLRSADGFAALLRAAGVEPETKEGPPRKDGKRGTIYAFAKTDPQMEELLADEDHYIRALAEARLGEKSNILQTRAETLGWMASRGPLCVYLRMYGAHTTRWSGGDSSNFQNFKKPDPEYPEQAEYSLRDAILPPEGYILAKPDASQIECIAEGQLVLTRDRGEVLIENIVVDDFVWDGVEWVRHQGLICRGEKYVIEYDGLTATFDHIVYTREFPNGIALGYIKGTGFPLKDSDQAASIREEKVRGTRLSWIQDLWRAWNPFQFFFSEECRVMGARASAARHLQELGNRPDRQQQALRTGQSAAFHTAPEREQPVHDILGSDRWWTVGYARFQASILRLWLWARSDKDPCRAGPDWRGDSSTVQTWPVERNGYCGPQETWPVQKTRVYDLLNAGSRHRFMVNGVIVSNCRLLNFVAGQDDVIERFRNGQDPYINVASAFYGYPVNKKDHPKERQVGKVLELQAGYGSGGPKISATLRTKAGIILTPEEGIKARDAYRDTHPAVVELWRSGGRMLSRLAGGPPLEWGPTTVRDGRIYLPNGCPLNYNTLEYYKDAETGEEYWRLKTRRGWTKMYGAKLVENLIQALARVVISQAMIRIVGLGYRIVGTEHDSLWILIPKDGKEKWHIDRCLVEMSRTPEWLPGIPLAAECN